MSKEELKIEKVFFDKLAEIVEEQFEKGEKCQCGKKLPCRSKALVLNGYANIYLREALQSQGADLLKKIVERINTEEDTSWGDVRRNLLDYLEDTKNLINEPQTASTKQGR